MDLPSGVDDIDTERALFALGAVIAGGLTTLVYVNGADVVQRLLFLSFTAYLAGAAIPPVYENVPEYKRSGAIALGGVGAIGYFVGTSSALPLLFLLGAIAALLRLW